MWCGSNLSQVKQEQRAGTRFFWFQRRSMVHNSGSLLSTTFGTQSIIFVLGKKRIDHRTYRSSTHRRPFSSFRVLVRGEPSVAHIKNRNFARETYHSQDFIFQCVSCVLSSTISIQAKNACFDFLGRKAFLFCSRESRGADCMLKSAQL